MLTQAAIGSHWIRRHGGKYVSDPIINVPIDVPEPIFLPEAVREYETYQSQHLREVEARNNYSLLCDFSHANAACLLRYQRYSENGNVIHFVQPKQAPEESFLPIVNCCLIDLFTFIDELLGFANETLVRSKILTVLTALARLAPPHLTGPISL